jgi:hypothetical protein
MTDPSEFMKPVDAVSAHRPDPGRVWRPSRRLRNEGRKTSRPAARIEVRWLPVEALRPDGGNARVHSDRQVARIADSIAAFGFNVPVLIDGNGGVLAGHGRVLAARRLGLKEVPTIALDHLTEGQRRAFMIADNRLGELASWDEVRLGLELKGLKILDLDFSLSATGFELSDPRIKFGGDLRIKSGGGRPPSVDAAAGRVGRPPGRSPGGARLQSAADSPSKDGRPMDRVGRPPGRSPAGARLQVSAPAARAGDAWTLGPHRLDCGDDSDPAAFLAIDAAIRQWQGATGESVRLHPKGETFASILRARGKRDSETDSCVAVRTAKLSDPRAPAPLWETPHDAVASTWSSWRAPSPQSGEGVAEGDGWGVDSRIATAKVRGAARAIVAAPKRRPTPHPALRATFPSRAWEGERATLECEYSSLEEAEPIGTMRDAAEGAHV